MDSRQSMGHIRLLLFLFLVSLYMLTSAGYVTTSMGVTALLTTQSLILESDFSLDKPTLETGAGKDGKYYTYMGLVFILVVSAFAVVSKFIGIFPNGFVFMNQILTAIACIILFDICRELKYSKKTSIVLTLVYGVGTMAWVHSRYLMPEPLTTIVYLTAFLFLLKYRNTTKTIWLFLCGCFTGLSLIVRVDAPLFILAIVIGVLIIFYDTYHQKRKRVVTIARDGLIFILPLILFFLVYAYFNYTRFGSVFEVGYATKARGIKWYEEDEGYKQKNMIARALLGFAGMWIIPCRSIFFINPVLIFIFWAVKDFWRKFRFECLIIGIMCILHVLLYSSRGPHGFSGSSAWGIRYMIPFVAFMVVVMGTFVGKIFVPRKRTPLIKIFTVIFVVSVALQLIGMSMTYHLTQNYLNDNYAAPDMEWVSRRLMNMHPRWNLITMNVKWLFTYTPDFMYASYFLQDVVNVEKYVWQGGAPRWIGVSLVALLLTMGGSGYLLKKQIFHADAKENRVKKIRGKRG